MVTTKHRFRGASYEREYGIRDHLGWFEVVGVGVMKSDVESLRERSASRDNEDRQGLPCKCLGLPKPSPPLAEEIT